MTLRASASSAATAEVSTPFWLSTFWTIAAALPEVACASLRPECATVREPPARQQKHPRAIQKKRLGGSPVLLMKPAVPWQELIFGSASANSATTAATDARAASQRHAVGYSRRVHARANEQVCSGHAHAHARKGLNLSGLKRRQLAAQCLARTRADLPDIVRKVFVSSIGAAGCRRTVLYNGLQARRTNNQLSNAIHCTTVKGR